MVAVDKSCIMLDQPELEALAGRLFNALEEAEADRAEYLQAIRDNRELLNAKQARTNAPWEGACDLHLPLLRYFRNAFMARCNRALLTPTPIHYVEGRGEIEREQEGDVEQFLFEQARRQIRLPRTYRPALCETHDDGTGVVYVTWDTRTTRLMRYQDDAGTRALTPIDTTVYDGPRLHVLPIEHAGVYPAAERDVQLAQGAYVRLNLSGNDLLQGVNAGKYDKDAVDALIEQQSTGEAAGGETDEQDGMGVSLTDASYTNAEVGGRRYDMVEWYWYYSDDAHKIAIDWLITMHQPTRTIIRATPNPWGHGRRPLVFSHILPPKFGVVGESLGDLAGQTQSFVTGLFRLMYDAATLQVDPELAVGTGITPDEIEKWRKERGPGRIRKFNAEDLSKVIQPFNNSVDPNRLMPMLDMMMQFAERSVGFNNAFAGQPASRAVTATELERMLEEGSELILDMTDSASHALTDVGELILALDYEFSGNESILQLWDAANPHRIGEDVTQVLGGTYDVTASGTNATSNRAIQQRSAQEMYAALKDDPFVVSDPTGKRAYALRKTLLIDGFRRRRAEVEGVIGTEEDAKNTPAAQQVAQMWPMIQQAAAQAEQMHQMTPGMDAHHDGAPAGVPTTPYPVGTPPPTDTMMGGQ